MGTEQGTITAVGTDEAVLASQASARYGSVPVSITRMGGYSNRNYGIVLENGFHYTARIARLNRSAGSVLAEEHILLALGHDSALPVPRLINRQVSHQRLSFSDGLHYVHLFQHLEGKIDCLWWQQCSPSKLTQLFTQLALLHQEMRKIPALPGYTAARHHYPLPAQAPELLAATATGKYVLSQWSLFVERAMVLQSDMADSFPWHAAHDQWIHGDMQLENVLFEGEQLTALLDFELASWDACEKDAILSAFRTCKEGNSDAPFHYDAARLALALHTYQQQQPGLCSDFFRQYDHLWKPFFCLDQCMVYLNNAFDGIWQLAPGIGFLPCFNEVLQYRSIKEYA